MPSSSPHAGQHLFPTPLQIGDDLVGMIYPTQPAHGLPVSPLHDPAHNRIRVLHDIDAADIEFPKESVEECWKWGFYAIAGFRYLLTSHGRFHSSVQPQTLFWIWAKLRYSTFTILDSSQ